MSKMYVYNVPVDQTVRIRSTPSSKGTILVNVPFGSEVEASPSDVDGWYNAEYKTYKGYMMAQYLTKDKPSKPSSGGVSVGDWTTGTVHGGALFCRKKPDKSASYWGRFQDKAVIPIKIRTDDWYETYWAGDTSKVGYVSKSYVTESASSGSSEPKPSGRYAWINVPSGQTAKFYGDGQDTITVATHYLPRGTKLIELSGVVGTLRHECLYDDPTVTGYVDSTCLSYDEIVQEKTYETRYGTTTWKKSLHASSFHVGVRNIQTDLLALGYAQVGNVDGMYGTNTETAAKKFQADCGLTADGIFGKNSKQKLWELRGYKQAY